MLCVGLKVHMHENVSKSFRTGRLERELQMVQLSATRCNCRYFVSQSSEFCSHNSCIASQRVYIVVVYFVMTQSGNFWIHPRTICCFYLCVWGGEGVKLRSWNDFCLELHLCSVIWWNSNCFKKSWHSAYWNFDSSGSPNLDFQRIGSYICTRVYPKVFGLSR
jgi:hypothetical protein